MCGITGYWVREGQPDAWLRDFPDAVRSLRQRGPDGSGTWVRGGGGVAFGHTRLSILDLSELGRQPMISDDDVQKVWLLLAFEMWREKWA